jgi:hypothetical protein
LRSLARKAADEPPRGQPTPRRGPVPQTPARKTPGGGGGGVVGARTPGTLKKTPRGGGGAGTVATPHTARAVKQLQLTVGRSGGVRSTRTRPEIRRESQRDMFRAVARGPPPPLSRLQQILAILGRGELC